MGQLSETLETIREHLRAAADESQRYILSAETREEQVAAVLRTHTLARLGLVRLVRESVEHEPDGGRRATIESEATAAGRELLWVLDGNAPAADGLDVVAERSGPATGLPRPARPVAVVEQRAQSARERTAVQSPLAQYIPPSSGGGNTQPAQATLAGM